MCFKTEADGALYVRVLSGSGGVGAAWCACPVHRRFPAHLRGQLGTNYGVYLGKGLVITAAHVVGRPLTPTRACASLVWTCLRMRSRKALSSGWT